ncbi:MAG: hypothetical protein KAV82_00690 [Phycisphaerae bacterium]|nr:hypothetical protein [Phycisphaerae bacterium]
MNQHEKTLVTVIVVVAVVALGVKVVYPKWVAPMFEFEAEILQRQDALFDLESDLSEVETAREKYREYVDRTGGTDEKAVGDMFTSTLNELLDRCRLKERQVSPKSSSKDRKTGLVTLSYSIRGKGSLQQAVLFLKNFYELPYISRFKNVKLTPQKTRKRGKNNGEETLQVALTGGIDVLVPPTFFRSKAYEGDQPPRLVKYRTEEYASIWEKEPFTRPVKQKEPVVIAEKPKEEVKPPPPPPPPVDKGPVWAGDPQRNQKIITSCLQAIGKVQVVHRKNKKREYVAVGEDLDGGKLLMVHPFGVLVRRKDGGGEHEYLYPIGEFLVNALALNETVDEPQLRAAALHYLANEPPREEEPPVGRVPPASCKAFGDLAGPPEDLAGSLEDMVEMSGDLAGPPEDLAGSLEDAEASTIAPVSSPSAKPKRTSSIPPRRHRKSVGAGTMFAGPPEQLAGEFSIPPVEVRGPADSPVEFAGPPEKLANSPGRGVGRHRSGLSLPGKEAGSRKSRGALKKPETRRNRKP